MFLTLVCGGSMGVLSFATYWVLAAWVYSALLHTVYWQHGCTQLCYILSAPTQEYTWRMFALVSEWPAKPEAQSYLKVRLWLQHKKRKERQTVRAGHSRRMQSAPPHSCLCCATSAHQPTQLSSTLALLYTLIQHTANKRRLCSSWNSLTGTMIPPYSVGCLLLQSMQKNHCTKPSDTQTHTQMHTHMHAHTHITHTHTHTHTHACPRTHTHSIYTPYTPSSAQQISDEMEGFLFNYVNYTVTDFINFLHFTVLQ